MRSVLLPMLILPMALAPAPAPAQEPGCPAVFDFATAAIRDNYAGWDDKVTPATRPALDSLTAVLRPRAERASAPEECATVVREWMAFFRDGHMGVWSVSSGSAPAPAPEEIRARFAAWERIDVAEEAVRAHVDAKPADLDPVEGIWESVGAPYRLAVVRSPGADRDFAAVVLKADGVWWAPGEVKATFRRTGEGAYASKFYLRDHSEEPGTARVTRNLLAFDDGFAWVRVHPVAEGDLTPEAYELTRNSDFRVRRIGPDAMLVQVPTMSHSRAPVLDSLLRTHRDEIARTPDLVIDLRGNGGGSDLTYAPLLPLLYTDSIRSPGVAIRSTPENVRNFEEILALPDFPEDAKERLRPFVAELRSRPGEFVPRGGSAMGFDSVLPFPRRVAVLVDGACASSCEQFVLAARQSAKATVYGENTAGVLDFGNVHVLETPSPSIRMRYATSRSLRLPHEPVDPDGIAPHVRIPAGEAFPLDWILAHLAESK